MPCNCDGMDESALMTDRGESPYLRQSEMELLVRKCNQLAELLCSMCQAHLRGDRMPGLVYDWATIHCKFDEEQGRKWDVEPK